MLFTTDQQTIEDLNIFGKHSGASIYTLFNRCSTRGGAAVLNEMFTYPLGDAEAINKRSDIIRYFSSNAVFPFDIEALDVAEQYLANSDERTKLAPQGDSIIKKLNNLIAQDSGYKFVYSGVHAFLLIIQTLRNFSEIHSGNDYSPYRPELAIICALLDEPAIRSLPKTKSSIKLSFGQLAELDTILRFERRETLKKLLRHIYQLDIYVSVGRIASERGFVFANAIPGEMQHMEINGVFHPQLPGAIPNNFKLTPERNVVFLTGANMAGKSTFMKSLGIAIYLAHMGFPVAAQRMDFSVMNGLYTTINLPDNLDGGTSHFYAEVLRIKKIAKELSIGKNLFVIFDELFRGTNVKDAYDATVEITAAFAKKINSVFIISTHIIEAGEVLKQRCENIGFSYLPTIMNGNRPVYTYTLREGITDDRHGMIIINNEGIIDLLKNGKITTT